MILSAATSARLAALCSYLSAHGFKSAPARAVAAARLLAARGLSLEGSDARATALQLGPVFCANADDQRRFRHAINAWATGDKCVAPDPPKDDVGPTGERVSQRTLRWVGPASVLFALVILLAAGAYAQYTRPRDVEIVVMRGDRPAGEGIRISAGGCEGITDGHGVGQCRLPASAFPLRIALADGDRPAVVATLPGDVVGWRALLRFAPLAPFTVTLPSQDDPGLPGVYRTTTLELSGSTTLAGPPIAAAHRNARFAWPALAGVAWFGMLFAVGMWWLRRGARLERRRAAQGRLLGRFAAEPNVELGDIAAAMRRYGLSLRQRQRGIGNRLDVRRTVEATARRAGLFSGVYGAPRERRFLALVRRQALHDHQAALAEALVAELCLSGADVLTFRFDTDASVIEPYTPAAGGHKRPDYDSRVYPLIEQVLSANEHAECMLFCEPAALLDPLSGMLAPWCRKIIDSGHRCTVFTVAPPHRWDDARAVLRAEGIEVCSTDLDSLRAISAGRATPAPVQCRALGHGVLQSDFRLNRAAPGPEEVAEICDAICGELGYTGFKWVQACAVYPEIQWPLTNAVGRLLVADTTERARLLWRIADLVWFRKAYMPDWLRAALIARLDEPTSARVRDFFWSLFAHDLESGSLAINTMQSPPASSRLSLLLRWLRVALALSARAQTGPRKEQLFVRYLLGRRSALSIRIPQRTMALLGNVLRGPTVVLGSVCIAGAGAFALYGAAAAPSAPAEMAGNIDATVRFLGNGGLVIGGIDRDSGESVVARRKLAPQQDGWAISVGLHARKPSALLLSPDGGYQLSQGSDSLLVVSTEPGFQLKAVAQQPGYDGEAGRWASFAPATTDTSQRFLSQTMLKDGSMIFDVNALQRANPATVARATYRTRGLAEPERVALSHAGDMVLLMKSSATLLVKLQNGGGDIAASTAAEPMVGKRRRVAWSQNGAASTFAECSGGGSVVVWLVGGTLQPMARRQVERTFDCSALALSPGGRYVAIGSADGRALLFDTANNDEPLSLSQPGAAISDMAFSEGMDRLALVRTDLSTTVTTLSILYTKKAVSTPIPAGPKEGRKAGPAAPPPEKIKAVESKTPAAPPGDPVERLPAGGSAAGESQNATPPPSAVTSIETPELRQGTRIEAAVPDGLKQSDDTAITQPDRGGNNALSNPGYLPPSKRLLVRPTPKAEPTPAAPAK